MMQMILKPERAISLAAIATDVAEALHYHAGLGVIQTESAQRLHGDDHAAAAGGLGAAARAAQRERLAGNHGGGGLALVHRVGIHDPGHGLRIGVDVRRGHVAVRTDDVHDFGCVAAGDALQFAGRKQIGIADHAAFAAAERDVHHRAFPGHPGRQGAHFIERDVGSEANSALGRSANNGMLDAIAGEDLQAAVVELHRDVHRQLERRGAQHFPKTLVEAQPLGGFIEPRRGGNPRIDFLFGDWNRLEDHRCLQSIARTTQRSTILFTAGWMHPARYAPQVHCIFRKPVNYRHPLLERA